MIARAVYSQDSLDLAGDCVLDYMVKNKYRIDFIQGYADMKPLISRNTGSMCVGGFQNNRDKQQ